MAGHPAAGRREGGAENDTFASPEHVAALETTLKDAGVEVEMFIYPGAEHAFFNDERPEVYAEGAARQAWIRALEVLREKLG